MGNEDSQLTSNPEQYETDRKFESMLFKTLEGAKTDKYLQQLQNSTFHFTSI